MKNLRIFNLVLILLYAIGMYGCADAQIDGTIPATSAPETITPPADPAPEAAPTTDRISINFNLKMGHGTGSTNVTCNSTLTGLGTTGVNATLHDARLYAYDFALIDNTGATVPLTLDQDSNQYANVALLDFEDGTGPAGAVSTEGCGNNTPGTHKTVTGSIATGHTIVGVQFYVGVPLSGALPDGTIVNLNHTSTDVLPSPLNLAGMTWSWLAGRKFMKFELNPWNSTNNNFQNGITRTISTGTNTTSSWYFHLGSTGCTVPAGQNVSDGAAVTCSNPNRFPVKFSSGFDPATNSITLDLKALFAASDITTDVGGAYGCMSGSTDVDCSNATYSMTTLGAGGRTWDTASAGAFTNGTKIFGQLNLNITDGLSSTDGTNSKIFFIE